METPVDRPHVSARLPRQSQGLARLVDMLRTARLVHGEAFGAVVWAAVQTRIVMRRYDDASFDVREATALRLVKSVRLLAQRLRLPPGQLAEALKHAQVVHREAFER